MEKDKIKIPTGAKRLSPLEMNKIAILKAHTAITFKDRGRKGDGV